MAELSSSIYQTLPEKSIRILELQPGEAHEALSCRLIVQLISGDSYEAISYVWGDPAKSATLLCNGESVGITSNLGEALTAFRDKRTVRRVWADAICINQQDNREREVQVGLMRLIYSSAKNVLGWIGPDPGTAPLAIAFIHKFNGDPDTQIQAARVLQLTDKENNFESRNNIETRWTVWIAIKALFEMPFFHRVWIVQELGLAKQAQLYYGLQSIDWRQVSKFVFIMDNQAAFLVTYLELKSWMVNHTVQIWQTLSNGEPRFSFIEVLNWARIHQATDARDTIYGFLGHPSATDRYGKLIIYPDYEASANEIFTKFARTWINRTKGLKVLSAVDRNLEDPEGADIPTWVPAWSTPGRTALFVYPSPAAPPSDDFISIIEMDIKPALRVRGFSIDTITAFSEMMDGTELSVTTLKIEKNKKIPFLVDHIWKTLRASPLLSYPTQEILDRISLTLVSGFCGGNPALHCLNDHRADFAAYLHEFEKIQADRPDSLISCLNPDLRQSFQDLKGLGSSAKFIQHMTWLCNFRRMLITSKGYIGIGPQNMQEGDFCCILVGSAVPIVLRKQETSNNYLLVGEAILQPFMNMEAFSLHREGKLSLREFIIV